MFIAYCTVPYSDYLLDSGVKYKLGWAVIFLFFGNLFINIGFIVIKNVIAVGKKCKEAIKKRKNKKVK
jgi:hypothetical protein